MHKKLKNTFKRSYSPASSASTSPSSSLEMKSQDSLEVPKQIRSASFDDIEYRKKKGAGSGTSGAVGSGGGGGGSGFGSDLFLRVPGVRNQRSKSFDSSSSTSYSTGKEPTAVAATGTPDSGLEVPKFKARRRSAGGATVGGGDRGGGSGSGGSGSVNCIHCLLCDEYARELEELEARAAGAGLLRPSRLSYSSSESLSEGDYVSGSDEEDAGSDDEDDGAPTVLLDESIIDPELFLGAKRRTLAGITVILSPNSPGTERAPRFPPLGPLSSPPPRHVPTLADDFLPGPGSPDSPPTTASVGESSEESLLSDPTAPDHHQQQRRIAGSLGGGLVPYGPGSRRLSTPPGGLAGETVLSLQVPVLPKQQRSASVDSSFAKVPGQGEAGGIYLDVPKAQRSRSVDIVLPTDEGDSYRAVPRPAPTLTKAIPSDVQTSAEFGETRGLKSVPDWSEHAMNGDHLWVTTSASGDLCYMVDHNTCSRQGPRIKCAACKMILHTGCLGQTQGSDKKFVCKSTFHDVGIRQYREQTTIEHHWVHRKNQKGKCKRCSKSFQSKLSFSSSKDIVAVICSWCKTAYHSKDPCFTKDCYKEGCTMGAHTEIIIPPSWIIKLPRKGSFKSSLRKSPKKRASTKKKPKKEDNQRTFVIKPIPSPNMKPVLVFINPRSGGNQGAKLMQKFQWLLNPRQVFDLSQGGPMPGLELYKKVPNLRILACGGDGTAGWLLSVLDTINISPQPPVAVLPLGTGNDLARALGWGGGYTDEPISKILTNIADGEIAQLDRWDIKVDRHPYPDPSNNEEGKSQLPLNVVNNYFSLGADAYIALEFHEAREAHPEKFNSRLRNKMFYGQAGGKDLLQRKWKDLSDYVTLECDGKDLTPKLKELKVHAILFLNIHSYGGGTHPWNCQSSGFDVQRTDDGLIEVIGLTTYQLALLQAGGHGTCLSQCRHAKLATTRTIPMQVDGEPCRLGPSLIEIKLRNQVNMVAKAKKHGENPNMQAQFEQLRLKVFCISMEDYENFHYNKEKLHECATPVCTINVPQNADLEQVRILINRNLEHQSSDTIDSSTSNFIQKLCSEWCFLDSITAERFFRIDRAQENLHYVTDIVGRTEGGDADISELFVLDPELGLSSSTNSPESQDLTAILRDSSREAAALYSPPSTLQKRENGTDGVTSGNGSRTGSSPSSPVRSEPVLTGPRSSLLSSDIAQQSFRPKTPVCRTSMLKSLHNASLHVKLLGPEIYDPSHLLEKNSEEIIKAARLGDLDLLKDLANRGFSLLSIDQQGMTTLHHSAQFGHKDVVRFLIASAPATLLNMKDSEKGQTALHKAASYKRRTICCMLVAAGASLNISDNQGMTPKQHAQKAHDPDLADYLENQEHFQTVVAKDQETTV